MTAYKLERVFVEEDHHFRKKNPQTELKRLLLFYLNLFYDSLQNNVSTELKRRKSGCNFENAEAYLEPS